MEMIDIFNNDAFSVTTLTALINERDFVPGRAGSLAFASVGEGVRTTTVALEKIGMSLGVIPTSGRNAPAPKATRDKATLRSVGIPQIKLEDEINVSELFNARATGTTDELRTAQSLLVRQMQKMNLQHDLTLERHRLGALGGVILDADDSVLLNLFDFFGVSRPEINFGDVFVANPTEESLETVRTKAQQLTRWITRNIKAVLPPGWYIHAFCGDNFFDALIESTSVKGVWDGWAAAERRLGDNYAFGQYLFAGIVWENYQGTDDNSTVAIDPDSAQFFPVNVPGLYAEYHAPGDFLEVLGQDGLPRYAKVAPGDKFNRSVAMHVQQNPLPIVTRPQVLVRGNIAGTENITEE